MHQYFLACGLFFWWPLMAVDPVRLRLSASAKRTMVWLGLPAFALLAGIELALGSATTGRAYLACGAALTLVGGALVFGRARGGRVLAPAAAARPLGEGSA